MRTTSKAVVMIGGGGHARVVATLLRHGDYNVLGLTVPDSGADETHRFGLKILGNDAAIDHLRPGYVGLAMGVGQGYQKTDAGYVKSGLRRKIIDKYKKLGFYFPPLVHPSAIIEKDVVIGEGAQIMAGVVLQPGVTIGDFCVVNTGSTIDHDCTLGDHGFIAPGVTMCGSVTTGENVFIGASAVVPEGRAIPQDAFLPAGKVYGKR